MTKKQLEILRALQSGPLSKADLYAACPSISYYPNWQRHFGEMLSVLVKAGKIERVGKMYRLKTHYVESSQKILFE